MLPHWSTVIRPCIEALDSGPIIEIGAFSGETTAVLAPLAAKRRFILHVVDPFPQFDTDAFETRFPDHFRLHRQRSHDALEHIDAAGAVLIDGDHNWYTVHGELIRLENAAAAARRPFPVVFFHDMEWPYSRRDMYWDPGAIPQKWRRPWARNGITWGQCHLNETGGVSRGNSQAVEEGGPRNGVLTAVEDFIEESPLPLELRIVPGNHGLGVLISRDVLAANPELQEHWANLHSTEFLLEQARLQAGVALMENAALQEALANVERLEGKWRTQCGSGTEPTDRAPSGGVFSTQICNICGGQEFVPGPNGRLTGDGAPPQCAGCRSLERQRSVRACLIQVPPEMLSWRQALQFAPDASLDPAWFRSFETSIYGGDNSIDLQEIDRADGSYDFISLSMVLEFVPDDRKAFAELARIGSDGCVIHNSSGSMLNAAISTHHEEPHGSFGRYHYYGGDIEERFEIGRHGFSAVRVRAVDPVTGVPDVIHFFCRQESDADILNSALVA